MGLYRVKVDIDGILRVDAESPEQAVELAKRGIPMMSNKELVAVKLYVEYLGPFKNHVIHTDSVSQGQGVVIDINKGKPDK